MNNIQVLNNRTQVIEKTGEPIYQGLKRMDTHNSLGCQYLDTCLATENTKCLTMRTTYRLDCIYCHPNEGSLAEICPQERSIYLGCSGRSLHSRMVGHIKDIKAGDMSNATVKHLTHIHPDRNWRQEVPVRARRVKTHTTTLRRLIDESLRLEKHQGLANSKGEWGRGGGLVRKHSVSRNNTK